MDCCGLSQRHSLVLRRLDPDMASSASFSGAAAASDLLRSSCNSANGEAFPLKSLGRTRLGVGLRRDRRDSNAGVVVAKIRKEKRHDYPWPGPNEIDSNAKGGQLSYLSHFKPLKEKPKPVTLPFEKPLMDLKKKIVDVKFPSSLLLPLLIPIKTEGARRRAAL